MRGRLLVAVALLLAVIAGWAGGVGWAHRGHGCGAIQTQVLTDLRAYRHALDTEGADVDAGQRLGDDGAWMILDHRGCFGAPEIADAHRIVDH